MANAWDYFGNKLKWMGERMAGSLNISSVVSGRDRVVS